ncbi:hypothetical protein [Borrelia hispanica]|nr:hypothetical protein [Borrelia hispanica]
MKGYLEEEGRRSSSRKKEGRCNERGEKREESNEKSNNDGDGM